MSHMNTKRASGVLNYNPGTFDSYYHHWVDATAGRHFAHESIIGPVSIDIFRVRCTFVKILVLVNIIRAFRGIVTSVPMLSELLENYNAILHELFGI